MSTPTTPATAAPQTTFDVSGTPHLGFGTLVSVELRKTVDTRAGRWLVAAILALTAAAMVLFFAISDDADRVFESFIGFAATPQGFLLPVLGILLVTSEWSQRTAIVTFALAPSRTQVIGAKVVAALLLAFVAFAGAVGVAALATVAGGTDDGFGDVTVLTFVLFLGLQLLTILQGVAYGLLLLNTPAAIVAFFVLPVASSILFGTVPALEDLGPWLDLQTAQQPLFDGNFSVDGEQLAHLGVASLIWIVLPFVAGWTRVMRAEIK
ncbi:ABC transporter permease [Nocardioides currus]|uniref:ABC transporter permease n=1 Tax=Nocardioides currus TaxID=2133958 RepID=A0A2R7YRT1_9ACTN|nr:ABC transporter permease [Nocardioides currus]PUA79128.1 ABC transporter permease [Nocardioides currus]